MTTDAIDRIDRVALPEGWADRVLFRVQRPGRRRVGPEGHVDGRHVEAWLGDVVARVREAAPAAAAHPCVGYVCLLGTKERGRREIADYYDARGPLDGTDEQTLAKPTWSAYLNELAGGDLRLIVRHVPTVDYQQMPPASIEEAIGAIHMFWDAGLPVLVGCSAAQGRTGQVVNELLRYRDSN